MPEHNISAFNLSLFLIWLNRLLFVFKVFAMWQTLVFCMEKTSSIALKTLYKPHSLSILEISQVRHQERHWALTVQILKDMHSPSSVGSDITIK